VPSAVQTLIEQLKHADAKAHYAAAKSEGKKGAEAKRAVPPLIQRIADDVWDSQGNPVNIDNAQGNTSIIAALKALDRVPELSGGSAASPTLRESRCRFG
jgi:hypothetical protein